MSNIKSIINCLVLSTLLTIPVQNSFGQKKNKKESRMEEYAETKKLIDTRQFTFVANRAYPQGGRSIDLTTNYGFVKIMGEETEGDMPFFGRGYSVPYGGNGGIKYDKTPVEDEKIEFNEKKMRISYRFEAKGKTDTYQIVMDIASNGNATLSITSNNRSHISYSGEISKNEED